MTQDLVPTFRGRSVVRVSQQLSNYLNDRDVRDAMRRGARDLAGQEIQALKADAAAGQIDRLGRSIHRTTASFMREAYSELESNHRSEAHQARFAQFHNNLVGDYEAAMRTLFATGVHSIGEIVARDVIVDTPRRRWPWER